MSTKTTLNRLLADARKMEDKLDAAMHVIGNIPSLIRDAVQKASDDDDDKPLNDLADELEKKNSDIAAAIQANTPPPTPASAQPGTDAVPASLGAVGNDVNAQATPVPSGPTTDGSAGLDTVAAADQTAPSNMDAGASPNPPATDAQPAVDTTGSRG